MKQSARVAILTVLAGAMVFAAVTLLALEGNGVAVLATTSPVGDIRRTRVWFAEDSADLWVESATADRPFYVDLASHPELTVELPASGCNSNPATIRARAELVPEPGGHAHIRSLLADRYGWADAWVALLQDTSASRAIRIVVEPDQDAAAAARRHP